MNLDLINVLSKQRTMLGGQAMVDLPEIGREIDLHD